MKKFPSKMFIRNLFAFLDESLEYMGPCTSEMEVNCPQCRLRKEIKRTLSNYGSRVGFIWRKHEND